MQVVKVLDAPAPKPVHGLTSSTIAERCGTTREDMLAWLWQAEPAQFAELAPMVLDCAGDGDTAAMAIMTAAGREIDALAEALDPGGRYRLRLSAVWPNLSIPFCRIVCGTGSAHRNRNRSWGR